MEESKPLKLKDTIEVVRAFPKEWYDPTEDEYWLSYLTEEEREKFEQRQRQSLPNS